MRNYKPSEIYNCDETALFYKMMPFRGLLTKIRRGGEKYKDRATLLLCTNMDGSDKLLPIVFGKSKNLRCFKRFAVKYFARYKSNKKAWIETSLFNEWLMGFDDKMKRQEKNILLLMDKCSSNKITYCPSNIEFVFLPKNSTSKTQPLYSGIIRSFKAKFYEYQMKKIVMSLDKNISAGESYKSINIKDAIIYTKCAWDDVTSTTIKNCWNKAGYNFDDVGVENSVIQIENYAVFCKKNDILDLAEQDELFGNIIDHNDFILREANDVLLSEKIKDNELDEIIE
ncbi:Tigger transposable element-derived protein 6 [Cucumispora dikerogammari]|nr:Tigger transposable element-derived protein 6 [Cucumispora dikerogammari]